MMPSPDMSFPVPLIHISETNSTNSYLQTLCAKQQGVAAFTTVVADFQTSGRGQRGNSWESEPKKNLLFSFVLFPDFLEARRQFLISQIVSLAIKEELDSYADDFSIKWPNDVVLHQKKICGILTEMSAEPDYINHVIIGVGINVNQTEFPEEIAKTATSLCIEMGQAVQRASVIAAVMSYFENYYEKFIQAGDLSAILEEYNDRLVNRNAQVRVLDPKGEFSGTALGINKSGELLVKKEDGSVAEVYAGEVSVRGIYGYV